MNWYHFIMNKKLLNDILIKFELKFYFHYGIFFFCILRKWGPLKKITNLGKSCQFDTTSYAQIIRIRYDSVMSYWSRANLTRLQYDMIEVVHDFSMTGQKSCLIGTICAYEVVLNWHDLPKFVIFFKRTTF